MTYPLEDFTLAEIPRTTSDISDDGTRNHTAAVVLAQDPAMGPREGAVVTEEKEKTPPAAPTVSIESVRSDAATIFGEELKEVSASWKKQAEQLAMLRQAHINSWRDIMEDSMQRAYAAVTPHLIRADKFLSKVVIDQSDKEVGNLNDAALRLAKSVRQANELLSTVLARVAAETAKISSAKKTMESAFVRLSNFCDTAKKMPGYKVSKEDFENTGALYYEFLGAAGDMTRAMEEYYIQKQHSHCFRDVAQHLLQQAFLRKVANGTDAADDDDDDDEEDEEDSDEEDA